MKLRVPLAMLACGSIAGLLAFGGVMAQESDADAVRRRALTLAQTGDYAQARADLERLLSERPDDLRTRKLLARVLIAGSATSEAASQLERVVAADSADAEGWSLLGRLHQDAQRFDAAARALTRAVGLDPTDVLALTALANAYVGLDRIDDADATFGRAVKANARRATPSAEPHASYAIFLLRVNRVDDAKAEARRAATLDPGHTLVREALRALERRPAATIAQAANGILPPPRFVDIAASAGVRFRLENSPTPEKHQIETMPGGVAVLDYDRDGLMDIYFTNGANSPSLRRSGPEHANRLYRNLGNNHFADVTERAGVRGDGYMMGAASADFDNDGFPDLFVAGVGRNILYRNLGNGTFGDVTPNAGLSSSHPTYEPMWSVHAAWLDFDRDGWLDLFIVHYCVWDPALEPYCGENAPGLRTYCHPKHYAPLPNQLFRNNRDGTFRDVSIAAGIAHPGKGMGAAVGDVDEDGWPDLFVANDTEPNFLFRNRGDGTFEDVAAAWGVSVNQFGSPVSAMGADLRDVDNDGRLDLFVTDLANEGFLLFRHAKTHFEDVSDLSGITRATLRYAGWSNPVVDYNNDGWKDLFSANGHVTDNIERIQGRSYRQGNLLLLNRGNGTFDDVSAKTGRDLIKPGAHRGAAVADFDNDGRVDLVVTALGERAKLLRNISTPEGRWLMLRLVGRTSNRDGLGTIVRLTLDDGRVLMSHATTSAGFASSSDPRVHFGVPPNRTIERVSLQWPSGASQTIEHPALNQILTIEETQ